MVELLTVLRLHEKPSSPVTHTYKVYSPSIISENSGQGLPSCLCWLEGNRDAVSSFNQRLMESDGILIRHRVTIKPVVITRLICIFPVIIDLNTT